MEKDLPENEPSIEDLRKECKEYEEKIAVLESEIRKNKSFNCFQTFLLLLPIFLFIFIFVNKFTNHSML